MSVTRRLFESRVVRRAARALAVTVFAIAIGALPMAAGASAEASSAGGDSHGEELCSYKLGL